MSRHALVLVSLVAAACQSPPTAPSAPVPHPAAPQPLPEPPPIEPAADDGVVTQGVLSAPMPRAVTSFGMAKAEGALYVAGGYHGVAHRYSREGQSRDLWRLDLGEGGAWAKVGSLDEGLQGLALVAHGNEVCRFGGNRIQNAQGQPAKMLSVDEAACFDVKTRRWMPLPPMPSGRSSHEAAVMGGKVYVVGGWRMGEDGIGGGSSDAVWHRDLVVLDLNDAEAGWARVRTPFERRAVGVAAAGGKLVVVGGLGPDRKPSRRVDVYDPTAKTWTRGRDYPADAFGVAAVGQGSGLLASARDGRVYRYEPTKDTWTGVTRVAFPRFFHRLAVHEGELFVVGGITEMQTIGRTRHTERLPLVKQGATLATWEMPFEGTSKNRQGMLLQGDSLYLFGGNNSLGQHDFEPDNFLAEGWRWHLPSMRMERVADFPAKRQTMQTVVAGRAGVAVGGFGHDGQAAVSHPETFAFDFDAETWSPLGALPRGRTQFGLAAFGDELWIFGGLNYDPSRKGRAAFDHVTNVLVAREGSFEQAGIELPGPRRAFGGVVHEGRYYMVGGMREGFQLVDGCLAFTFATKRFDDMPCPRDNRLSAKLVSLDGRLYVLGGAVKGADGKMKPVRTVEVFDPKAKTWSVLVEDLGFDTKHMQAMAYRHRLLLVSTHQEAARIRATLIDPGLAPR